MKKIITALIIIASNILNAQLFMDLDSEISDNIQMPVESLKYDVLLKNFEVKTKYPVICNNLNSINLPSDVSIKLINPNGEEQTRISLSKAPVSTSFNLNSKTLTAKTNEVSDGTGYLNRETNETFQQSLETFHNICLTYNLHDKIFTSNMEELSLSVYSKEYIIREPSSIGWQDRLSLKISIPKNEDVYSDTVYMGSEDSFYYTVTVTNLTGTSLEGLSLKEFVPYDTSALSTHFVNDSCLVNGQLRCVNDLDSFDLGAGASTTFDIQRSSVSALGSLQMMLSLYLRNQHEDSDSSNQGFVLMGSVDVDVEIKEPLTP